MYVFVYCDYNNSPETMFIRLGLLTATVCILYGFYMAI